MSSSARTPLIVNDDTNNKKISSPPYIQRVIFSIFLFFGLCNVYMLRVNLSVAILPMQKQFNWSSETKGIILSSFFFGYLFGQVPGGYIATVYGAKFVFGIGVLCTAILTLLVPLATTWNLKGEGSTSHVWTLIILRILMGVFESVTYPSLFAFIAKWCPEKERSKMVSFSFSGAMIGTAIAFPLAGIIISNKSSQIFGGWVGLFYCFGAIGIIWFILYAYFISESPETHPGISIEERNYIVNTRGTKTKKKNIVVTKEVWKILFTNKHILALYFNHFANNWALYTFLSFLPTYLEERLHFNIKSSAIYSVMPYLTLFFFQCLGGYFADKLIDDKHLTRTSTRILMESLGNLLPALALIWLSYVTNATLAFTLMTLAVGLSGFAYSGYPPATLDLSPKYSGIIYSISNTIATVPGVISPALTGIIVKNHTQEEWRVVFFIAAFLYVAGVIVWFFFCKAEVLQELIKVDKLFQEKEESNGEKNDGNELFESGNNA